MKLRRIATCALALLGGFALCGAQADESIEASIKKGAEFLLSKQAPDGHWSDAQMPALTALPVWALLGVHPNQPPTDPKAPTDPKTPIAPKAPIDPKTLTDPNTPIVPKTLNDPNETLNVPKTLNDPNETLNDAISKGVQYVLSTQRDDGGFYVPRPGRGGSGLGNYNTSVCLSALFESKLAPVSAMLKARSYITSTQLTGDDTMAGGFGYDKVSRRRYADLSNTSYALDAMRRTESLEELRTGGERADVDWDQALAFVENLMKKEGPDAGGAAYNERTPQGGTETNKAGRVNLRAYGSMTYAAVLSMCHAKLERSDPRVRQSLEYCKKNWTVDENPGMGDQGLFYFYDIMARALSVAGMDDVGGHDWKAELSKKVISLQKPDGSWYNANNRFWEADPVLCTSFAMLVLELCR